jgi:hypothetical protein
MKALGARERFVSAVPRWIPIRSRWGRPFAVGLSLVFVVIGIAFLNAGLAVVGPSIVGLDIGHYLDAARRWLETGTPYLPSEVAGPFQIGPMTYLHPPVAVYLFAPFLALPLILWWAIPIGIVAWSVILWRPADWAWPVMTALLAFSRFHIPLVVGNSDLWVWAAIAAGLRFAWPALLVVIKPSLFPFLFIGIRHRSWWIGAAVVALICLPFGTLWFDWISVIRNAPKDLAYSVLNVPWLLVPVIAWATRRRPRGAPSPIDSPGGQ